MSEITTVGLDLAKNVFQLHGADARGGALLRKKLRRAQVLAFFATLPPCVVAMEACGGAHFWGRELVKLGHDVRLIPPAYVKPFVKRQKNDANDAEAICEAAQRPSMRFVPIKSEEAQGAASVFRVRELLIRQRTQAINALRGHLGEYGHVVPQGVRNVGRLIALIESEASDLPATARASLDVLAGMLAELDRQIGVLDTPFGPERLKRVPLIGTRASGGRSSRRAGSPQIRRRIHGRTRPVVEHNKPLAPREPSIHGSSNPGVRRKVHIGMDAQTGDVRAVEFTSSRQGDSPVLPDLLAQLPEDEEIGSVTADGAYDTRRCHGAIVERGAEARRPIRRNGGAWKEDCPAARVRNDIPHETRRLGRTNWKSSVGYHVRSRVETRMNCLKAFGERIASCDPDRQTAEIQIRIAIMNRYNALGTAEIMAVG